MAKIRLAIDLELNNEDLKKIRANSKVDIDNLFQSLENYIAEIQFISQLLSKKVDYENE